MTSLGYQDFSELEVERAACTTVSRGHDSSSPSVCDEVNALVRRLTLDRGLVLRIESFFKDDGRATVVRGAIAPALDCCECDLEYAQLNDDAVVNSTLSLLVVCSRKRAVTYSMVSDVRLVCVIDDAARRLTIGLHFNYVAAAR